ncbi:MAG TPA: hypothetical protein VHE79_08720, partial [Spirochaetia bacterium]
TSNGEGPGAAAGAAPTGATLRAALRGLTPDLDAWAVLTASLAGALGLGAGIAADDGSTFAVVDTGVPLTAAFAALPDLAPWASLLTSFSHAGTLCIPLAGAASIVGGTGAEGTAGPGGGAVSGTGAALHAALAALNGADVAVAWIDQGSLPAPSPRLFPLALPMAATRAPDALIDGIISLVEQNR